MAIGKCVTFDTGRLGCMADVTEIAQKRCNGKSRCRVEASDQEIIRTQPCVPGVATYLETKYVCIPELTNLDLCRAINVDRQWKYVLSKNIEEHCMLHGQPLQLNAPSSMDIEITARIINGGTVDVNTAYATISDIHGNATTLDIPRTPAHRIIETNVAQIAYENSNSVVLFAFKAVGCEDIVAPDFTWIERKRNVITIGCVHNGYTWQVKCIGSKWIGFRGNCTSQTKSKPPEEMPDEVRKEIEPTQTLFSKGIQYALTIGITVLLCVVVITTGFVCLRKAEYKAKASKGIELQEMTGDYSNTWKATLMRPVTNDLNNPNASPPQQFYVLNQQNDTPIGTLH
ncbi:hypothetical protein CAPTEDRAFT_204010 [Capitella teleta]|uniref:SUEL-type lectin domain-containing protein n=1 Tax=Capitella teleta TaxID=283909 RepID=R7UVL6_CAPTE|nr:hypothetical protein CAPTEDRAFT_204010 [Capitella teleta]|eukprot:ELU10354.1 hypothetical protein CAPTEDRAFT_204010 [Capitella teleta]